MKTQLQKFALLLTMLIGLSLLQVNSQYTEFYGTTYYGGEYDLGTIFKTDGYGNNFQVVYNFKPIYSESFPVGKLCETDDGILYGMTKFGGALNSGVLYEWNPDTDSIVKKIDFNGSEKGSYPYGSLILADNGKLYGMTEYGGTNNEGVIFEWDPANETYVKKIDYKNRESGRYPVGSLI
jgi:uncharacterized repeat protein (TIGR03803 family)